MTTPIIHEPSAEALAAIKNVWHIVRDHPAYITLGAGLIDAEFASLRARLERAEEDSKIVDWLEKNYLFPSGHVRFGLHPFSELWHKSVKEKFPNGFWRVNFGAKDGSNRWATLRQIIAAAMSAPSAKPDEGEKL